MVGGCSVFERAVSVATQIILIGIIVKWVRDKFPNFAVASDPLWQSTLDKTRFSEWQNGTSPLLFLFIIWSYQTEARKISVYPFIDPQIHYDNQTYAGKVVLITGASRGIGLETARYYANAGASLTLVARKQETLDRSKDIILHEQPSAQILAFAADVRDVKKAEEAVAITVAQFGQLDILVTNAGVIRPGTGRLSAIAWLCYWLTDARNT
jgi:hypothetical protein